MNPVIKFTTLFGLLAVELAVSLTRDRGHQSDAHSGARLLCGLGVLCVSVVLWDADIVGVSRNTSDSIQQTVRDSGKEGKRHPELRMAFRYLETSYCW